MTEIPKEEFERYKKESPSYFGKEGGNQWLFQTIDGRFLPVEHKRGSYYKLKELENLVDIIFWSRLN